MSWKRFSNGWGNRPWATADDRCSHRATRIDSFLQAPVHDNRHAVHENILNAFRMQPRLPIGRAIGHSVRIENSDVCIGSNANATLAAHRRCPLLQSLRWRQTHFSQGFHQGQRFSSRT